MLEVGQYVGSYRILRKLGEGGMGAVYEGIHEQIARHAAIKVLLPQFARDKGVAQRFLNEARAVNLIGHPGLVEIYDLGQLPDGSGFIVMELLAGETLSARLERRSGRLALPEALHLLRQLAAALLAAHEKGIVHRDIKPDNVMLVRDSSQPSGERVKLLDFGIAKLAQESDPSEVTAAKLTQTGAVMGTALYMAPEQCTGAGRIDAKADVYALGAMLFHVLGGRPPFVGDGVGSIMAMHIYAEPPTLADIGSGVPHQVGALVARMLAKNPAERPDTAEILSETQSLSESFPFVRSALGGEGGIGNSQLKLKAGQGGSALTGARSQAGRRKGGRSTARLVLGLVVTCLGLGGVCYGISRRSGVTETTTAPAVAAPLGPALKEQPTQGPEAGRGALAVSTSGVAAPTPAVTRVVPERERSKQRTPGRIDARPVRNRTPKTQAATNAAARSTEQEIEATPSF